MSEWKLPEKFFQEHPFDMDSIHVGDEIFLKAKLLSNDDVNDVVTDYMNSFIEPDMEAERKETIAKQRIVIENMASPQDVVKVMRTLDPFLDREFYNKALTIDAADYVVDKLRTNGFHIFIENATVYLTQVDEKHIDRVAREFREFRTHMPEPLGPYSWHTGNELTLSKISMRNT